MRQVWLFLIITQNLKRIYISLFSPFLFTNRPFMRGRFSALSFRTSYLILLENSLLCLFSLYLNTLASLCPVFRPSLASTLSATFTSSISGTLHKFPRHPKPSI
uniref:Uncharacterized protein n=1 Tax=Rhizophora mucronata TaxID=61149 RepID=A0A2P2JX68_RHIMU